MREIAEELHLREGPDYRVSTAAPAHLEFAEISESRRVEARGIMERFDVEPHPRADPGVAANPENHWLTAAEVCSGQTGGGRPVSRTLRRLLEKLDRKR